MTYGEWKQKVLGSLVGTAAADIAAAGPGFDDRHGIAASVVLGLEPGADLNPYGANPLPVPPGYRRLASRYLLMPYASHHFGTINAVYVNTFDIPCRTEDEPDPVIVARGNE